MRGIKDERNFNRNSLLRFRRDLLIRAFHLLTATTFFFNSRHLALARVKRSTRSVSRKSVQAPRYVDRATRWFTMTWREHYISFLFVKCRDYARSFMTRSSRSLLSRDGTRRCYRLHADVKTIRDSVVHLSNRQNAFSFLVFLCLGSKYPVIKFRVSKRYTTMAIWLEPCRTLHEVGHRTTVQPDRAESF